MKTKRTRGDSLACIIADLSPMLRRGGNYFNMLICSNAKESTGWSVAGCAQSCASRRSDRGWGGVSTTKFGGPIPSSRHRVVHHNCGPGVSPPIPMRKLPTGEPCGGEPHARFGGRGR
jgi:hypothetical protein